MKLLSDGAGTQFDPELVKIFLSNPDDLLKIRQLYPDKEAQIS